MEMIYTIVDDKDTAEALASALLNKRIAACINIIKGVESHYLWKGKIKKNIEIIMFIKTSTNCKKAVLNYLNDHHPYGIPFIATIDISDVPAPYQGWANDSTKSST